MKEVDLFEYYEIFSANKYCTIGFLCTVRSYFVFPSVDLVVSVPTW
jgi:hypothetical protein